MTCYIPEGYETLVDDAWCRYRAAARFALAYGRGGKRKRTRVDNIKTVVDGTSDLPAPVQVDTFEITRLRLTHPDKKIGSVTKLPLSASSLRPTTGGFEFPLQDGDFAYLGTTDPRFDPEAIEPGWLLVHRPSLDEVTIELPTAAGKDSSTDSLAADSPADEPTPAARIAPASSVGRQVCVHDRLGEVASGGGCDRDAWECHPRCPLRPECPHRDIDPRRFLVRYLPLCPVCAVPLASYWETASGLPTDWRCDNPSCSRFGRTTALAASTQHGWQLTEDAL